MNDDAPSSTDDTAGPADPPSAATRSYGIAPPQYRLPDATRPGQVTLQIADLDRSLSYYENVLGLRVIHRSDERAMLGPEGDDTPLVELHERPGANPAPRRGVLGLYHFAILVPDRQAFGRFVAHLAELGIRPGAADHLVSEALYLHDPDGLGIEVYADRPRSAWHHQWREIAMDTTPLDLADVARAAGGQRWTGMPAGTVIGHVHLHVGDLESAAVFYHAALGLDKTVWSYPGALFMSAGGYHHHLGTNTWVGADARAPGVGDARLLEWQLVLPRGSDAEAAARNVAAAGHVVTAAAHGWTVGDPWGTQLRIRGEDDVAGESE
ncbi:MAG: VOC family protein [Gemmatimonadaceae bacterium]